MKIKNYPPRIRHSIMQNYFNQLDPDTEEPCSFEEFLNLEIRSLSTNDVFDLDKSMEGEKVWINVILYNRYWDHDVYHYGTPIVDEENKGKSYSQDEEIFNTYLDEFLSKKENIQELKEDSFEAWFQTVSAKNLYDIIYNDAFRFETKHNKTCDFEGILLPGLDIQPGNILDAVRNLKDETSPSNEGIKESNDKLIYELDWEFIQSMAERMQKNKSKYPRDNWKKPIDVTSLKDAFTRHFMSVIQNEYEDEGAEYGHLVAIALNAMMIWYQLKNNS